MDTQLPFPKKGEQPPIFGPCLLWPNGWMDQDATCFGGRPRPSPRPHCARWGPSSASPKRGHSPQFSAHVCCGQTASWIKICYFYYECRPRPTSHYVTMGTQLPLPKGAQPPIFCPFLLWPNGRPSQLLLNTYYVTNNNKNKTTGGLSPETEIA